MGKHWDKQVTGTWHCRQSLQLSDLAAPDVFGVRIRTSSLPELDENLGAVGRARPADLWPTERDVTWDEQILVELVTVKETSSSARALLCHALYWSGRTPCDESLRTGGRIESRPIRNSTDSLQLHWHPGPPANHGSHKRAVRVTHGQLLRRPARFERLWLSHCGGRHIPPLEQFGRLDPQRFT
jgi:hypothetical protein